MSLLKSVNVDSNNEDCDASNNNNLIENNILALENIDHEKFINKVLNVNCLYIQARNQSTSLPWNDLYHVLFLHCFHMEMEISCTLGQFL